MSELSVNILLRLVDRLTAPARQASNSFNQMGNRMRVASAQITQGSNASTAAVRRLGTTASSTSLAIGRLATNMRNMRTLSAGFSGLGVGGAGMIAAFPLAHMIKSAADYEDKLLDIRKVWQGSDQDYARLITNLRGLNTQIPMARDEIATLLEEGVKSGIGNGTLDPVKELTDFTLSAAQFAKAFQLPNVEDAASKLAKIKGALGLTMPEFTGIADTMNTLAGNFATTESDLLDIVRRVGGIGKAVGGQQGLEDSILLGAAQTAAGVKREVAATGLRALLGRLSQMNKPTREALQKLKLNPNQVRKDLPEDVFGTVRTVLQRVAELPAHLRAGVLAELSGMKTFDAFAPLLGNLELLDKVLAVYEDPKRLTMASEYERRITGINSALQLTSNIMGEVNDSIVMAWKPQIITGLKWLRGLAESMKGSPILQWTAGIFAGLAALSLIALPFGILGGSIFSAVLGMRTLLGILGPVARALGTASLWGIGFAQLLAAWPGNIRHMYRMAGAARALSYALGGLARLTGVGALIAAVAAGWPLLKEFGKGFWSGAGAAWEGSELHLALSWLSNNVPGIGNLFDGIRSAASWLFGGASFDGSTLSAAFDLGAEAAKRLLNPLESIAALLPDLSFLNPFSTDVGGSQGALAGAAAGAGLARPVLSPSNFTAPPTLNTGSTINNNQKTYDTKVSAPVTINVTTNADPGAIGAAAGGAVGNAVRGAISVDGN